MTDPPADSDNALQFVVHVGIGVPELPRLTVSLRLRSNVQRGSNPQQWYRPVSDFFDEKEIESPLYVLKVETAVELAQNLLKAVEDSRTAYDAVD